MQQDPQKDRMTHTAVPGSTRFQRSSFFGPQLEHLAIPGPQQGRGGDLQRNQ